MKKFLKVYSLAAFLFYCLGLPLYSFAQTTTLDKALYPTDYGLLGACWTSNGDGVIPSWQGCSGGGGGGTPAGAVGDLQTRAGASTFGFVHQAATATPFLVTPSSANFAALLTNETGSGLVVFDTNATLNSPVLVTPALGVATATTINKLTFTAPATSATITIANGKTLVSSNSLTLAGTDCTRMTFPATSASVARTDAGQTFTGTQTFGAVVGTTWNGNTWATGTGTLSIGAGKTATVSNTLTFTGADSSSVAFGAGGTVLYNGGAAGTPSSITLTNGTGLPIAGITGLGTNVGTALAVNVGSAGAPVLFNGAGGTPSSITLTNGTGLPLTGLAAQAANTVNANATAGSAAPTAFAIPASTLLGRGSAGNVTAVTLGTNLAMSAGGVLSASGGGSGCTTAGSAGQVLTDNGSGGCTSQSNMTFSGSALVVTGTITASGAIAASNLLNQGTLTDTNFCSYASSGTLINCNTGFSGTGNLARVAAPTFTTPVLGDATATTINKLTFTAPATSATITIANGKVFTASNTLTLTGTDSTSMAFPTTNATIARTDAGQTFTGTQTFGAVVGSTWNGNTWATGTGTLSIAAGKTGTFSNTLTFTGTDASSVAFGTGGTVLYNGGALGTPASGSAANLTGLPLTGLASVASNTIIANGTGSSAAPTAIAVAASQLFGRGSAGNVTPIALGTNLAMVGNTINASGGGTGCSTAGSAGQLLTDNGAGGCTSNTTGTGVLTGLGVNANTAGGMVIPAAALTANLPVIGGGSGTGPSVGTRSGNTTAFVTTTGAQTSGDCVKIDANGNHIANGSACGGGGGSGTVNSGVAGQLAYFPSSGTTVTGTTLASLSGGVLSLGVSGTLGAIVMGNATSGTLQLQPAAGALGTVTALVPAANDTLVNLNSTQTLAAKTLTNPALTVQALTDTTTITWNMNSGNMATVTLGGNRTLSTPTNIPGAGSLALRLAQDATGTRLMTWPANFKWAQAVAPTLSTAGGAIDLITCSIFDGSNFLCNGSLDVR